MNDNYSTPQWLYDMFSEWFDPCVINNGELRSFDGLGSDWKHKTYVNPPYSKPEQWVKKAIEENKKGKTIAMLLRVDTSTKWFAMLIEAKAQILWCNGRLKFGNKKQCANFASMLVILPKGEQ